MPWMRQLILTIQPLDLPVFHFSIIWSLVSPPVSSPVIISTPGQNPFNSSPCFLHLKKIMPLLVLLRSAVSNWTNNVVLLTRCSNFMWNTEYWCPFLSVGIWICLYDERLHSFSSTNSRWGERVAVISTRGTLHLISRQTLCMTGLKFQLQRMVCASSMTIVLIKVW